MVDVISSTSEKCVEITRRKIKLNFTLLCLQNPLFPQLHYHRTCQKRRSFSTKFDNIELLHSFSY